MEKDEIIEAIRKASFGLRHAVYLNILDQFQLLSYSVRQLEEMPLERLEELQTRIEGAKGR